jgi:type III pantothenate kinase
MILTVDIGNTQTTFGFYHRGKSLAEARLETSAKRSSDEYWLFVHQFTQQLRKIPEGIQGVVIASVVPAATTELRRMAKTFLKVQPVVVTGALDTGLTILHPDPLSIGADRICGLVAAFRKYGGPVIVADFGTATTIDAVTKKGEFPGGTIMPGPGTMAAALHSRTAQLPAIDIQFPESVIGNATKTAMQAGVVFGALDAAEGIIRRMRRIIGKHAIVVATGGYAPMMAEQSTEIRYVEPSLVLEGARLIYERLNEAKKIINSQG